MWPRAWLTWTMDGRTDGRRSGGRQRRQAASAHRLLAGIEGSGGGGQAKIAMLRQGRGLRGRTDGPAGTGNPAAERRDGLQRIIIDFIYIHAFIHTVKSVKHLGRKLNQKRRMALN